MTSPLTPVSANGSAGTGGAGPQPGPAIFSCSHVENLPVSTDISTAETAESRDGTRRGGSVNARIRPCPPDFDQVAPGKTVLALKAHYRAGNATVMRWLREAGVAPTKPFAHAVPADLAERARTMSVADLAERYAIPRSTMGKMLKREGIIPGVRRNVPNKIPVPADLAELAPTMTQTELSRHYGVSSDAVKRWLREEELAAKRHVPTPPRAPRYNRPPLRYVRQPGHSNVAAIKSNYTAEDHAADVLRRFGPVYRCDEKGGGDPKGKFWRVGNVVLTGAELIARAERKVAA